MNTTITFPPPAPTLKLERSAEKWAATLAEERRRLLEDQEALREREQNLREYEARLRALQAEIEAFRPAATDASAGGTAGTRPPAFLRPSSRAPFHEDPALQAAWEKLHRAREILEAEQNHLRDDRITLREHEAMVKRREEAVAAREAILRERERLIAAALPDAAPIAVEQAKLEQSKSAVTRITSAPFNLARSVLGGKKK